MNKIKLFILIFTGLSLILSSCEKLEDINTDPNNPTEVSMASMLLAQLTSASYQNYEIQFEYAGGFAQQKARPQYNDNDRYNVDPVSSVFARAYRAFNNLEILKHEAEKNNNMAMLGAAQVLQAFQLQQLTDAYGDIPYSEAISYDHATGLVENLRPVYDTQESIYDEIIILLQKANTNLAKGVLADDNIGAGDAMFEGDISLWQKFCNSLLLRVYIRISSVDQTTAADGISTILGAPASYPIMQGTSDNASISYLQGANENGWHPLYSTMKDRPTDNGSSETMVNYLISMNDPRLTVHFNEVSGGGYIGYPIGITNSQIEISSFSDIYTGIEGQGRAEMLMSYAEVQLILAEAAQRNMIGGNAQTYYENAVNADFEDLGIPSEAATYLANEGNFTAASDPLTLIYREKWVSTYLENSEGWCLIRRIGTMGGLVTEVQNAFFSGHGIPKRIPYPTTERDLNAENWQAAISRQNLTENLKFQWGTLHWAK